MDDLDGTIAFAATILLVIVFAITLCIFALASNLRRKSGKERAVELELDASNARSEYASAVTAAAEGFESLTIPGESMEILICQQCGVANSGTRGACLFCGAPLFPRTKDMEVQDDFTGNN
jgi:hypothetical protein